MKRLSAIALVCCAALIGSLVNAKSASQSQLNTAFSNYIVDQNIESQRNVKGFKYTGWQSLTDKYLIVTAAFNEDYLIETQGRCVELRKANAITLNRFSNFSLSTKGDSITPNNAADQTCLIKSIYALTPKQMEELLTIDG